MTRSPQTRPSQAGAAQTRAPRPVPADVQNAPEAPSISTPTVPAALVAFAQLGAAIAAVARFPNHPVPEKLVARIGEAQANVDAALAAGWDQGAADGAPAGEEARAYDDQWIRERFESLDAALRDRFEALDARIDALRPAAPSASDPA